MASITIRGVDRLQRKLQSLEKLQDALEPPMQRAVIRLQRRMADYPPQRPGSSYVRTGTLGRRWTTKVERTSEGLRGKVGNNTEYAPFVQSKQFQASVHRGRWQTDQQVVDQERDAIVRDFERTIERELNK